MRERAERPTATHGGRKNLSSSTVPVPMAAPKASGVCCVTPLRKT